MSAEVLDRVLSISSLNICDLKPTIDLNYCLSTMVELHYTIPKEEGEKNPGDNYRTNKFSYLLLIGTWKGCSHDAFTNDAFQADGSQYEGIRLKSGR